MALRAGLLASSALLAVSVPAAATDYTWIGTTSSYSASNNWSPTGPPATASDTAVFGATGTSIVTVDSPSVIGGWTFNAGAQAYKLTFKENTDFDGAGIVISGGSATITIEAIINFLSSSTAGSATITNNHGMLQFRDSTRWTSPPSSTAAS
jgi:hypothetical protein